MDPMDLGSLCYYYGQCVNDLFPTEDTREHQTLAWPPLPVAERALRKHS